MSVLEKQEELQAALKHIKVLDAELALLRHPIQYSWSRDEETFHGSFLSREEAISAAEADDPPEPGYGRSIWTGERAEIDMYRLIKGTGTYLIDHIEEAVVEQAGEISVGWISDKVKPIQMERFEALLTDTFQEWLEREHLMPQFWGIVNIEETSITGGPLETE